MTRHELTNKSWLAKKTYDPDYTKEESEILIKTYYHLQQAIGAQNADHRVSNMQRRTLWADITAAVNAVGENSRKIESVKKRYTNMLTMYKAYRHGKTNILQKKKSKRVLHKYYFGVFDEFYSDGGETVKETANIDGTNGNSTEVEQDSFNLAGKSEIYGPESNITEDEPVTGGQYPTDDDLYQENMESLEMTYVPDEDIVASAHGNISEKHRLKMEALKLQIRILEKQERNLDLEYMVFNKVDKLLNRHLERNNKTNGK